MDNKIKIIYEDEYILVAVKPQDIPVQPDKKGDTSFFEICEQYYNPLFLLHRLDRPVGGVIIFAKNKDVAAKFCEIISSGQLTKKYLAVVNGVAEENAKLSDYLLKNERLNMSRVVQKGTQKSKMAELEYTRKGIVQKDNLDLSLILVTLITGRHHQIRVQLSNQKIPIVADRKYNKNRQQLRNVKNLALWSYVIGFKHPVFNKYMEFKSFPEEVEIFNCFQIDNSNMEENINE